MQWYIKGVSMCFGASLYDVSCVHQDIQEFFTYFTESTMVALSVLMLLCFVLNT